MPTRLDALKARLPIPHLTVDGDCWYSCPKSGDNCNDALDKTVCDCGADALNEDLERLVAVVNVAHLRRNTRWAPDKTFEGEWVVIPEEDFLVLRNALAYWLEPEEQT